MSGTNQEIISSGLTGAITDGWQYDDMISTAVTPVLVSMLSSTASGGLNTLAPVNFETPDINSAINKTRCGLVTSTITTVANSRAQLQGSNTIRYQILSSTVFGFGADVCFNGGQIDFTIDPVVQLVGFSTGTSIPTQGAYVRPPYVGETSFYKCVLTYFDTGTSLPVNVIFDTIVPYDSANNKFLSIFILVDGSNDSITYTIQGNNQTYTFTINNVLVTYPLMWSSSIINIPVVSVGRASSGLVTPLSRSILIDKLYRYIKPNYNY